MPATSPSSTPSVASRPRRTPPAVGGGEQAELLNAQIKRLGKSLHPHLVPDDDVQRLLRIPGIGKAVAFSIRLEVDDIARFESDRAFFSYCRVVPGASNSGDRVRHKRSRDGNRSLKLAFSHAAVRAVQYYPEVRAPTTSGGWGTDPRSAASPRRWHGRSSPRRSPGSCTTCWSGPRTGPKQEDFNGQFKGVALSRTKKEQWPLLASPASITGDGERESARPPSAGMGSE